MLLRFLIKYVSTFGQTVFIRIYNESNENNTSIQEIACQYHNNEYWTLLFENTKLDALEVFYYDFVIKDNQRIIQEDTFKKRHVVLSHIKSSQKIIFDDFHVPVVPKLIFASKVFQYALSHANCNPIPIDSTTHTHRFNVYTGPLRNNLAIAMLGSAKELKQWNEEHPILMNFQNGVWDISLRLNKSSFPIEYKFVIYDIVHKKVIEFENGSNRYFTDEINDESGFCILNHVIDFQFFYWKAAGINVQLSSLKSYQSWGIGDFNDLTLLIDWTALIGLKLIQLLPINDTIANHDQRDAYPYAAISVNAIHPAYMCIPKLVQKYNLTEDKACLDQATQYNSSSTQMYTEVVLFKSQELRKIYNKIKTSLLLSDNFTSFLNQQAHWLKSYAAFCCLRDFYKTSDHAFWKSNAGYDESMIEQMMNPISLYHDDMMFYCFIQYELHLQLLDCIQKAHSMGIVMKGDLPIGVGRYGVETWKYPTLFHMNMQAGAPPDAFTSKGQNWSFPTYNWEQLYQTGYNWWRQRLSHMQQYFDAVRIDHVLGFFRIWSIPIHAVDGRLGYFVPSIPLRSNDFKNAGVEFDEKRFCTPYIHSQLIQNLFGAKADWVQTHFFENDHFKEDLNTQRKALEYCISNGFLNDSLIDQIMQLYTEVILIKDETQVDAYHFRIDMSETNSFKQLSQHQQSQLLQLYYQFFYHAQNELWKSSAQDKLVAIQESSTMLLCAEDLGMVPDFVESFLHDKEILTLHIERMPSSFDEKWHALDGAPYLSVAMPSTHDMSPVRLWWQEDPPLSQHYYSNVLQMNGMAPDTCSTDLAKKIMEHQLQSRSMWSVFLLQDLLSPFESFRCENPFNERINDPSNPNHYWNYRVHFFMEDLLKETEIASTLQMLLQKSDRLHIQSRK